MSDQDKQEALPRLRDALDDIDRQLVALAAERQKLVSKIGEIKAADGRPLRDFKREREVLDGVRRQAEALGIEPEVAEDLVRRLIEASLTVQEQDQVKRAHRGMGKHALVIGGAGRLGQWFVNFLDAQGFRVTVSDPIYQSDHPWVIGAAQCTDRWEDLASDQDVIVLATPPGISQQLLETLSEKMPTALVFDVASIKSPLIDTLRVAAQKNLKICSVHPMFGPSTQLLSGRHVLVMDVGNKAAMSEAIALFSDTMAQTVVLPIESHDRLMALVLGLSHLINLAFVTALTQTGVPADELAKLSSTTFGRQLEIAQDVVNESPVLYYEIQKLNTQGELAREALSQAIDLLGQAVAAEDSTQFVELMHRGQQYLQSLTTD